MRAARTRWHVDVESQRAPQQRVSAHARAGYAEVPSSSQSPCDPALGTERCVKAAGVRAHLHAQPRRCQEPQGHGSLDQGLTLSFGIPHVELEAAEPHAAEKSEGRYAPDVQHLTGCGGGDFSLVVLARDHWPGNWQGRGRGRRPGRCPGRGRRRGRGRGGDHGRDLDRDPWGRRRWDAAPRLVVEPSDFTREDQGIVALTRGQNNELLEHGDRGVLPAAIMLRGTEIGERPRAPDAVERVRQRRCEHTLKHARRGVEIEIAVGADRLGHQASRASALCTQRGGEEQRQRHDSHTHRTTPASVMSVSGTVPPAGTLTHALCA